MTARSAYQVAAALTAAALAWLAACSWRGLIEEPHRFTSPALLAALLVAGVGAGARHLRVRWYLVPFLQLLVAGTWLHHRQHADTELGGWLPTPDGVAALAQQVRSGAEAVNTYAAPVPADYANAPVYLLAAAIGVIVLVDLLACGLRHPAWAGLPVLVAVTVPISVLDGGLPVPVYAGTGLLFALLLAVIEADRALVWGQDTVSSRSVHLDDPSLRVGVISAPALGIGALATVAAMVLSLGVPIGDGIFRDQGDGRGDGDGSGTVNLANPLVNMQKELRSRDRTPLLEAVTDARDPSYVRLTVLDLFTGGEWRPSTRSLDAVNVAEGLMPEPPGIRSDLSSRATQWQLRTTDQFETGWLPTPVPVQTIAISRGDWRFDPNFLDIANVDEDPPRGVDYELTGSEPAYTAADLDDATGVPPADVLRDATDLPALPDIIQQLAQQVTAGGATTYQRVRLLQDWFRRDGGFEYNLDAAGSAKGIDALESFLTVDKVGYCEQFAAAMAVMARSIGIPARVVVGFLSPRELPGGRLLYTSDDLHAWPEIYFRGYGWVRFEPTPSSRTGTAPAWTRGGLDRPESPTQRPSASATPSRPVTAGPQEEPANPDSASDGGASFPTRVVAVSVLALLVVLVLALPGLARSRRRARRLANSDDSRLGVELLWEELHDTAVDHGIAWPSGRSPRMIADELATRVLRTTDPLTGTADRDALGHLVRLVERSRYSSSFELDGDDRARAVATVARWTELIGGAVSTAAARRARFVPRSVLVRRPAATGVSEERNDLTEVG